MHGKNSHTTCFIFIFQTINHSTKICQRISTRNAEQLKNRKKEQEERKTLNHCVKKEGQTFFCHCCIPKKAMNENEEENGIRIREIGSQLQGIYKEETNFMCSSADGNIEMSRKRNFHCEIVNCCGLCAFQLLATNSAYFFARR